MKIYEAKAHNVKQRAYMNDLWNQFDGNISNKDVSSEIYQSLRKLYSEPHRFYHNLGHINFLLGLFTDFGDDIEDKLSIYFTIWFHDAVYDPRKSDNERQSASLAAEYLPKLSVPENKISKVERMILATEKHSAEDLDGDGRLFLDFDLAILGAEGEVYDEYAKAIRREYNFVSEEIYAARRKRVLEGFLRRDFIYLTDRLREKFEKRARRNIEEEIGRL